MGACYTVMKDYNKALKSFNAGLAIDEKDEGCLKGKQECMIAIQRSAQGGGGAPDPKQVQEAMKDPEIQKILKDPQMNIVLQQMQQDPKAAQEILQKDPQVAAAVEKLMAAGIIR